MSKSHQPEELFLYREAFDPDQIELLDVVFQNVRAAIGRRRTTLPPVSSLRRGSSIAPCAANVIPRNYT
jgi:hypothetical protein